MLIGIVPIDVNHSPWNTAVKPSQWMTVRMKYWRSEVQMIWRRTCRIDWLSWVSAQPSAMHWQTCSMRLNNKEVCVFICNNNNNNNNTWDIVCGSVIMIEVLSRVHLVHLMNVQQRQAAADPQTKPTTWAESLSVGCYCLHPPLPLRPHINIIIQWIHFKYSTHRWRCMDWISQLCVCWNSSIIRVCGHVSIWV